MKGRVHMKQYIDLIILIFAFITGFVISIYLIAYFINLIPRKIAFEIMIPNSLYALMIAFSVYLPQWLFVIGIIIYLMWVVYMLVKFDPEIKELKQLIKAKFNEL